MGVASVAVIALSWVGPASAADCPDPAVPLASLHQAALGPPTLADVEALAEEARVAIGCGGPADPTELGRLWLAEAALREARGGGRAADHRLRAAARVAPEAGVAAFGEALAARREALAAPAEPGALRIQPVPPGGVVAIDGVVVDAEPGDDGLQVAVDVGLHFVQVGWADDDLAFVAVPYVPFGSVLVVTPTWPAPPPVPVPVPVPVPEPEPVPVPVPMPPPVVERPERSPGPVVLALGTGVGSVLSFVAAAAVRGSVVDKPYWAGEYPGRTTTNRALIGSGIGLAGVAAASGGWVVIDRSRR